MTLPIPNPSYEQAGARRYQRPSAIVGLTVDDAQTLIDATVADYSSTVATQALIDSSIAAALPAAPTLGDIQYWDGSAWTSIGIGSAGQVLTVSGGIPAWVTP